MRPYHVRHRGRHGEIWVRTDNITFTCVFEFPRGWFPLILGRAWLPRRKTPCFFDNESTAASLHVCLPHRCTEHAWVCRHASCRRGLRANSSRFSNRLSNGHNVGHNLLGLIREGEDGGRKICSTLWHHTILDHGVDLGRDDRPSSRFEAWTVQRSPTPPVI